MPPERVLQLVPLDAIMNLLYEIQVPRMDWEPPI
jgi:hypothetical protein